MLSLPQSLLLPCQQRVSQQYAVPEQEKRTNAGAGDLGCTLKPAAQVYKLEKEPGEHAVQAVDVEAPISVLNLPASQFWHAAG